MGTSRDVLSIRLKRLKPQGPSLGGAPEKMQINLEVVLNNYFIKKNNTQFGDF